MHPEWFGDSYDVVKRYFVELLLDFGFETFVDPMFTGEWCGIESEFYRFLKVRSIGEYTPQITNAALLLDPDTGVGRRLTPKHTTVPLMVEYLRRFPIVFSFDQSFSRSRDTKAQMIEKLNYASELGAPAFFYNSHASFLFMADSVDLCKRIQTMILGTGLPSKRLVSLSAPD